MDILGKILEQHEGGTQTAEERRRSAAAWQLHGGQAPEERLLAFDRWMRLELEARIDWRWAGAAKAKRIEQCRTCMERIVLDLWRRGWLLDGRRLAVLLVEFLDNVAKYQARGAVQDFWAYFNAAAQRHVGLNAEEIQREAMSAGAQMSQVVAALVGPRRAAAKEAALPELLAQRAAEVGQAKAETLREKQSRARARQAACKADADQRELFG